MKKKQIGVYASGVMNKIGSMFVAVVVADKSAFGKFRMLPSPKMMWALTKNKVEHLHIMKYEPRLMDETEKNLVFEIMGAMEVLNTYPEFWKHDININCSQGRQVFEEVLPAILAENLKKVDLKVKEWNIGKNGEKLSKACMLAKKYADYHIEQELEYIKTLYGDFNTPEELIKREPDNPHIRRYK